MPSTKPYEPFSYNDYFLKGKNGQKGRQITALQTNHLMPWNLGFFPSVATSLLFFSYLWKHVLALQGTVFPTNEWWVSKKRRKGSLTW